MKRSTLRSQPNAAGAPAGAAQQANLTASSSDKRKSNTVKMKRATGNSGMASALSAGAGAAAGKPAQYDEKNNAPAKPPSNRPPSPYSLPKIKMHEEGTPASSGASGATVVVASKPLQIRSGAAAAPGPLPLPALAAGADNVTSLYPALR
jgi:hypothetical protein